MVGHAAPSGNLDMIAWLLQQEGVELTPEAMATAAANGTTAVCAFLLSQQCPWNCMGCSCSVQATRRTEVAVHVMSNLRAKRQWLVDTTTRLSSLCSCMAPQ
jgi:hypothetical protein